MKQQDTYREVRIIERNGFVAEVYIPDLTEEERARRRKVVEKSAADLLASIQKK